MQKKIINNLIIKGISVNNIDTTSGIFVGINNVNNWSSHQKNNHGFGSVSNSQVSENFSMVIDNDVIDTPIENHVVTYVDGKGDLQKVDPPIENNAVTYIDSRQDIQKIDVKEINTNSLFTNSAISVGENILNGWSAHRKTNEGTGSAAGITQQTSNANIVIDNDVMDGLMSDNLQN
ncbi:hypothetical protein [Neobacillus niacini]|uniref:hypothetical protein n=1 Tax=Neobacillus niacini TaxID=86668 RepID=UPI0021CB1F61|nr:hypothetical protein [Neobacillus niacini]MCM3768483.1 hypothetical protein [Neobacillus niacini]